MIIPAMNTLWFWFDKATRRALHGTPADCERKCDILVNRAGWRGVEIFLDPLRMLEVPYFSTEFIRLYRALDFRCLHIGNNDHDFLDDPRAPKALELLYRATQDLETPRVLVHAHHLRTHRAARCALIRKTLPGVKIIVENNGFDTLWGSRPDDLEAIFADAPDMGMCLDITHVADYETLRLSDFTRRPVLAERIEEIHASYSTFLLGHDPYEARGLPGYTPFHALFSLVEAKPSASTLAFMSNYPIVMEGVVPLEDDALASLVREKAILTQPAATS